MPIRPEDIDPTIQALLRERCELILHARHAPTDPVSARFQTAVAAAWKRALVENQQYFWGGGLAFITMVFGPAIAAGSGTANPLLVLLAAMGLSAGWLIAGVRNTREGLTKYASLDAMRYAGEQLGLSRGETAYCEAVAALVDAGSVLSDEVQRDVLQQLNGLLASFRRLEDPLRRAQAASGTESIGVLEQELAGLMSRRDSQTDAEARAMMDQSVELCRRRLEASRAVEPARQKVEAQQELILQTMASVSANVGRTGRLAVASPDLNVDELRQSVAQVDKQTRAVEEAVAEVVALSA